MLERKSEIQEYIRQLQIKPNKDNNIKFKKSQHILTT